MDYNNAVSEISKELNLPSKVVDKVFKAYWRFIRETIQKLPLKDNLSEEQFQQLRTNFNIPSLGKLSCTYDRASKVKKRYKYIKDLREKT